MNEPMSSNRSDEDEDDISPRKRKSVKSKLQERGRPRRGELQQDGTRTIANARPKAWTASTIPNEANPSYQTVKRKSSNRSDEDEADVSPQKREYKTSTQASETWIGKASQRGTKKTEKTCPERTTCSVGMETNNIIPDLQDFKSYTDPQDTKVDQSSTQQRQTCYAIRRFRPLTNLHNNCWFNANIQALISTNAAVDALLEVPDDEWANHKDMEISRFLRRYKKNKVLKKKKHTRSLLQVLSSRKEGSLIYGQQNDAHEFISLHLGPMKSNIGMNTIGVEQCVLCTTCNERTQIRRHEFTEIIVPVLSNADKISLQREVDKMTKEPDLIERRDPCEKCRNFSQLSTQKKLKTVPQCLIIVMQRNKSQGKMLASVEPSDKIFMTYLRGTENDEVMSIYQLRSVIVHKGDTCDVGHYVTMVRKSTAKNGWILCDDHIIENARPQDIAAVYDQSYIIMYDNTTPIQQEISQRVTSDSTSHGTPNSENGAEKRSPLKNVASSP
ncbi:ubiquitin carboxyl-terminal hydrolase 17-like protein 6 [Anneissia japonica]|uniref:ubiquitin carboxyl-terminal hydrolase 17-like protein 6 n=1 Tax=Anneissia japonica TaxID=1529436 RepID=UPI001425AD9A|nr:ubiquitin carboxyl-terminal hydrolase 17-like protein 6 [Anneissia japonica]